MLRPSIRNGGAYTCEDHHGHVTCTQTPTCAAGTHATPCGACAPNDVPDTCDCQPPSGGGCWVTGGGFIVAPSTTPPQTAPDGHDNFGGNAKAMKDGRIQGHWNHVDHGTQNHAKGKPEYIVCRHINEPGPGQPGGKKGFTANQAYFGGHAEWRDAASGTWASGYWFDVVVKDHGEPGSVPHVKNGFMVDTYHFTIRKIANEAQGVSGQVVYTMDAPTYSVGGPGAKLPGDLVGGNIQLHPPNNGHPYKGGTLPNWVSYE